MNHNTRRLDGYISISTQFGTHRPHSDPIENRAEVIQNGRHTDLLHLYLETSGNKVQIALEMGDWAKVCELITAVLDSESANA